MTNGNKFVRHESCPQCGSKDNVSVYSDGFKICENAACGWLETSNKSSTKNSEKDANYFPIPEGEFPKFLTLKRKISKTSIDAYQVKYINNRTNLIFPYFLGGISVAAKYRAVRDPQTREVIWHDKNFWSQGDISKCRLFGMNAASDRKKSLIITEGELDCLAAHTMYGLKHNVVSISNGASSAPAAIKEHLDWILDNHDMVYICFDMDEAGKEAARKVIDILPIGRVKLVNLPSNYKDACEMLADDKGQDFRNAVNNASEIVPKGVLTKEEAVENTLDYILNAHTRVGISTGYKKLDALMGGFRPGELITLAAGTGVGKTSFTLNLTYNAAIEGGMNTLFVPLEMSYKQILTRFLEIHTQGRIMTTDGSYIQNKEQLTQLLELITEKIDVYNHVGSMKIESLIKKIEYYAIANKTKLVVLDHKDAAVNTLSDEGGSVKLIDNLVSELKRVALQYDLTILLVSHLSRSKDDTSDSKTSLNRIRGSAGVAQNSDMVIGLERDRNSHVTRVITMKAHRIFGLYDEFNLYYNPETLRIEESLSVENHGSKIQKQVRKDSSSEISSTVTVRAEEVHVPEDVHTRLPDDHENGSGDLPRNEGASDGTRSLEANCSEDEQSEYRLKDFISRRKEANQSQTEKFFDIRSMGNQT